MWSSTLYIKKPRVNTYPNQTSVLGKWKIWNPLIFPDTCYMNFRLLESRVLPCCRIFIEKNPYFTPFFFWKWTVYKCHWLQQCPAFHPKADVIWLVNFDIPTIKMDRCIFLPAVTCTFLKGLNFPWNGYPTQYNHTLRLVEWKQIKI